MRDSSQDISSHVVPIASPGAPTENCYMTNKMWEVTSLYSYFQGPRSRWDETMWTSFKSVTILAVCVAVQISSEKMSDSEWAQMNDGVGFK